MKHRVDSKCGFTLIELLIVIIIMGVLALLIFGNYSTSLKKGRDVRRKNDLSQIQKALEMYYEDYSSYPASISLGSKFCYASPCYAIDKVYMIKLPNDPQYSSSAPVNTSTYSYLREPGGSYYYLLSCIENKNDLGNGVSQTGYKNPFGTGTLSCGTCGDCKYAIGAFNAPLIPTP
ncbi:hypothetical protein COY90_04175 [Candidatus Roizmanbacteria bacterium CG_4_10_14_0_8_um_filter_39_9]|uniref:Type II secretion system protein GspG C-terminal domain-containing protein n=1 Tax=Candidatus Roizmanbacteria bacterium CG_4_10_14_0_8_um_filter_39_9 TaxID=1974829 RepID=A0A2M7QDD2_9BACT|nr:MAG: hypothetical protein COY90_04175 [Candidatus Roizmanbacteria bacterium CG_4_10_14_0_8_um_filter_39_9]